MSSIIQEEAIFTENVVVPDPGEPVLAADLEIVAQALANRTRAFFDRMRVVNWDAGRVMSTNDYEPWDVAYDAYTGRWYILHLTTTGPESHVSSSADGVTWDVEEHTETGYVLRTICAGAGLADGVLVGGDSSNITQRVGASPTWTDRAVSNMGVCYQIEWSEAHSLFVAVGEDDPGTNPGVWTSPDGTTWTQRTIADAGETEVKGITISSTGYAVAWTDGQYWTSPDLITWTAQGAPPGTPSAVAVTANGGTWMLSAGNTLYLSTDNGITWGAALGASPRSDNDIAGLVAVGATFVALAPFSGTADTTDHEGELFYTTDLGTTWRMIAFDRLALNWPASVGSPPPRRQLYLSPELGQLAAIGVRNTAADDIHLFRSLAIAGGSATT